MTILVVICVPIETPQEIICEDPVAIAPLLTLLRKLLVIRGAYDRNAITNL